MSLCNVVLILHYSKLSNIKIAGISKILIKEILFQELGRLGLAQGGVKADLVQRIFQHYQVKSLICIKSL